MKERPGRTGAMILAACVAVAVGAGAGASGQEGLGALVAADGAAPGWSNDGPPQRYEGEGLYTYIDGGAEIYREYGFRQVIVQDYKDAGGRTISLEIFEMASPEAAFGMFTFKRSGQGKVLSLGSGGELEDYYLNFWKGPYLVTLTGFDAAPETLAGLQAVAAAIDAKIADRADPPALCGALPAEGLNKSSLKYLKGPLGLNNAYSFFTARGLGFAAAVKADYTDGSSLIILDYGTGAARAKAWPELQTGLEASGRFKPMGDQKPVELVYQDPKGRFIAFRSSASRLLVGIAVSAPAALSRIR
jgi:hypothetical protein